MSSPEPHALEDGLLPPARRVRTQAPEIALPTCAPPDGRREVLPDERAFNAAHATPGTFLASAPPGCARVALNNDVAALVRARLLAPTVVVHENTVQMLNLATAKWQRVTVVEDESYSCRRATLVDDWRGQAVFIGHTVREEENPFLLRGSGTEPPETGAPVLELSRASAQIRDSGGETARLHFLPACVFVHDRICCLSATFEVLRPCGKSIILPPHADFSCGSVAYEHRTTSLIALQALQKDVSQPRQYYTYENEWCSMPSLNAVDFRRVVATTLDGRVTVSTSSSLEQYDAVAMRWIELEPPPFPRGAPPFPPGIVSIDDNLLLSFRKGACHMYDLRANAWCVEPRWAFAGDDANRFSPVRTLFLP